MLKLRYRTASILTAPYKNRILPFLKKQAQKLWKTRKHKSVSKKLIFAYLHVNRDAHRIWKRMWIICFFIRPYAFTTIFTNIIVNRVWRHILMNSSMEMIKHAKVKAQTSDLYAWIESTEKQQKKKNEKWKHNIIGLAGWKRNIICYQFISRIVTLIFLAHHSSVAANRPIDSSYSTPLEDRSSRRRLWLRRIASQWLRSCCFIQLWSDDELNNETTHSQPCLVKQLSCRWPSTMAVSQAAMNVILSIGFHLAFLLDLASLAALGALNGACCAALTVCKKQRPSVQNK